MLEVLERGTSLVVALVTREITVEVFLEKYDNYYYYYYYYYDLDGHEATPLQRVVLDTHRALSQLHERVQGIVDLVYHSDLPLSDYEAAGRVRPAEAGQRIVALAKTLRVTELLDQLRASAT